MEKSLLRQRARDLRKNCTDAERPAENSFPRIISQEALGFHR